MAKDSDSLGTLPGCGPKPSKEQKEPVVLSGHTGSGVWYVSCSGLSGFISSMGIWRARL